MHIIINDGALTSERDEFEPTVGTKRNVVRTYGRGDRDKSQWNLDNNAKNCKYKANRVRRLNRLRLLTVRPHY